MIEKKYKLQVILTIHHGAPLVTSLYPPNHLSVVHNSQIKGPALQSPEGFLPFVLLVVGVDSDQ